MTLPVLTYRNRKHRTGTHALHHREHRFVSAATSTTWPSPTTSRARSAIMRPVAAHSAAIESPIEIPVLTGGPVGIASNDVAQPALSTRRSLGSRLILHRPGLAKPDSRTATSCGFSACNAPSQGAQLSITRDGFSTGCRQANQAPCDFNTSRILRSRGQGFLVARLDIPPQRGSILELAPLEGDRRPWATRSDHLGPELRQGPEGPAIKVPNSITCTPASGRSGNCRAIRPGPSSCPPPYPSGCMHSRRPASRSGACASFPNRYVLSSPPTGTPRLRRVGMPWRAATRIPDERLPRLVGEIGRQHHFGHHPVPVARAMSFGASSRGRSRRAARAAP